MRNKADILAENKKRLTEFHKPYDPITGEGSPIDRFELKIDDDIIHYLPHEMASEPLVQAILDAGSLVKYAKNILKLRPTIDDTSIIMAALTELRYDYDFEFWAAMTFHIQDKKTLQSILLKLNRGQRKLFKMIHKKIAEGKPIRGVIGKARQWGGSTLVEAISSWIQVRKKTNWHMAVCAQDDNAAKNIREMYVRAAEHYPEHAGTITLKPYAKSTKNLICEEHGGIIGVGSIENPKQFRSYNYPMCHLSEVAFWGETPYKSARGLAQSIKATVPSVPYSMIIEESTAKGYGNYFHDEWLAAETGKSDYFACFVSWFENENNVVEIDDNNFVDEMIGSPNLIEGMEENYHWYLWDLGANLSQIAWYRWYKKSENMTKTQMFEEYPSTPEEMFVSSGRRAFPIDYVKNAEKYCEPPKWEGELFADNTTGLGSLLNVRFESVDGGRFRVWKKPDKEARIANRYIVVMDVGGTTDKADYTRITVFDRIQRTTGGKMEVVADWGGHIDQDLGAWKAAQIATFYTEFDLPLLVIEVNSLRRKKEDAEDGELDMDHALTILNEISEHYDNLYARNDIEKLKEGLPLKWGFHTNKKTKPMIIDELRAALRDVDNSDSPHGYIEKNKEAVAEMNHYEQKQDGTYGAIKGKKDDYVITRAIGTHIDQSYMDLPREVKPSVSRRPGKRGMADF